MLKGHDLGKAIEAAMKLKGVSRSEMARHFGVRPESTYDWTKFGRIAKDRLPALFAYFSEVVQPSHWGLEADSFGYSGSSQSLQLDADIIRAAIILAKRSFKLAHDEELVIERNPEAFSQALRAAIATRQRMEGSDEVGSGSGDGEVGATGGSSGAPEDGEEAKPKRSRKAKAA